MDKDKIKRARKWFLAKAGEYSEAKADGMFRLNGAISGALSDLNILLSSDWVRLTGLQNGVVEKWMNCCWLERRISHEGVTYIFCVSTSGPVVENKKKPGFFKVMSDGDLTKSAYSGIAPMRAFLRIVHASRLSEDGLANLRIEGEVPEAVLGRVKGELAGSMLRPALPFGKDLKWLTAGRNMDAFSFCENIFQKRLNLAAQDLLELRGKGGVDDVARLLQPLAAQLEDMGADKRTADELGNPECQPPLTVYGISAAQAFGADSAAAKMIVGFVLMSIFSEDAPDYPLPCLYAVANMAYEMREPFLETLALEGIYEADKTIPKIDDMLWNSISHAFNAAGRGPRRVGARMMAARPAGRGRAAMPASLRPAARMSRRGTQPQSRQGSGSTCLCRR